MYSHFFKLFYGFNRPFHEVKGYDIKLNDDGSTTLFINALGIDSDDIDITVKGSNDGETQWLRISGKTTDEIFEEEFSINLVFQLSRQIKKITKIFRNGLLILKIEYNAIIQPDVEIVNG